MVLIGLSKNSLTFSDCSSSFLATSVPGGAEQRRDIIVSECLRIRMVLTRRYHSVMVYTQNESWLSYRAQSIVMM
jgi:hypothetical protein